MSHSARARDWDAKGKGKAPAYTHPPGVDSDPHSGPDKAARPKHLRFLVLDTVVERPEDLSVTQDRDYHGEPTLSSHASLGKAQLLTLSRRPLLAPTSQYTSNPSDDLKVKVAELQTHVHHVRRALRAGSGTVPEADMHRAKEKLKDAVCSVKGIEQEMAARVKGNETRISRMERKLSAMRRGA
ncbi:hypothetical protein EVJ58_g693 [Rhodofomes roseus]|uniref:Uncharacterized protein n=1 Tax=Rhodofomes roseus TaxID=34475 RepID=A0A4Y9Z2B4_9APHY|nr:hypothetical protein EVJ58_g693 [Rhodofomes roseus]